MHTRESITAEVMSVIQVVRGSKVKSPPLTLQMRVIDDLKLEQDSMDLVMLLQDRTGIRPPKKAWEDIRTIGEIVELLLKYAPDAYSQEEVDDINRFFNWRAFLIAVSISALLALIFMKWLGFGYWLTFFLIVLALFINGWIVDYEDSKSSD